MHRYMVLVLVALLAMIPVAVCFGEEVAGDAPETSALPDDWFGMLEVHGGTTLDVGSNTFRPYVAGKFLGYKEIVGVIGTEIDVDEATEAKGPVTGLVGATYNLGNLRKFGVDVSWAEHFGFNAGVCGTYEFETGDLGWRVMLSVVDLSFSEGNADRQKQR